MGRFQDFYLAPFYDYNDDGVYNPNDGDYPKYDLDSEFDCSDPTNRAARAIFGDINYWWVFNDKGNIHPKPMVIRSGWKSVQSILATTDD